MITSLEPHKTADREIVFVHSDTNIFLTSTYTGEFDYTWKPTVNILGFDDNIFVQDYTIELGNYKMMYVSHTDSEILYRLNIKDLFVGFMDPYDDTEHESQVLTFLSNMSKEIKLEFVYDTLAAEMYATLLHASKQYVDPEDNSELCSSLFIGAEGEDIYIYNVNETDDDIEIIDPTIPIWLNTYAEDFDESIFKDKDRILFKINYEESQV